MSELDPRLSLLIAKLRELPEPEAGAVQRVRSALEVRGHQHSIVLTRRRAFAIAASLVLLTSAAWLAVLLAGTPSQPPAPERLAVQFVFVHAGAQRVALVGDFNDWDGRATQMTRAAGGVWSVVLPLRPGRFAYSFVVDGQLWFADPQAPLETNDFGRPSSVVYVGGSETSP
jgi:Glycogen recognition site of AMP-activated protein kinase